MFCFQRTLTGHKNIIRFVDSSINLTPNRVYEVMILMQYCRSKSINHVYINLTPNRVYEVMILMQYCRSKSINHVYINLTPNRVYEVMILMQYCRSKSINHVYLNLTPNSYQNIISSDMVNTSGHTVDTLTGLLIDWIYNFDVTNIIWMDLYIRNWKVALRNPIFRSMEIWDKRSRLSWKH